MCLCIKYLALKEEMKAKGEHHNKKLEEALDTISVAQNHTKQTNRSNLASQTNCMD